MSGEGYLVCIHWIRMFDHCDVARVFQVSYFAEHDCFVSIFVFCCNFGERIDELTTNGTIVNGGNLVGCVITQARQIERLIEMLFLT